MAAEVDALAGVGWGEVAPERVNHRNGYRQRPFDTRVGTIELAIPKLRRGSYFPDWLSDPRRRAEKALVVALDVDVDTTTLTGELLANITTSVAQWERRIIGARTTEALAVLKARGVRLGRPVELPQAVRRRVASERIAPWRLSACHRRTGSTASVSALAATR